MLPPSHTNTTYSLAHSLPHSLSCTHLQRARREGEGSHATPLLAPLELGGPCRHVGAHAVAAHGELVLVEASK